MGRYSGVSLGGSLRQICFSPYGSGKRGGYRTRYIFGGRHLPLLIVFAKKENLIRSEQSALIDLSKTLIAKYGEPIMGAYDCILPGLNEALAIRKPRPKTA